LCAACVFCVVFLALVSQQQCSQLPGIKNDQLSVQININSAQSLSRKKLFILSTHTQSKWESGMGFLQPAMPYLSLINSFKAVKELKSLQATRQNHLSTFIHHQTWERRGVALFVPWV